MNRIPHRLILASASHSRQNILVSAGVVFEAMPADIDEHAVKQALLSGPGQDPTDLPFVLAQAKADDISRRNPDALVLGADQVLILEGEIFNKPASTAAARSQLQRLKGKTHQLETAAAMVRNGELLWSVSDTAYLTLRDFSADALAGYLVRAGDEVCDSVGGYKVEGPAIQLFERIEGDYFSILGLPLLAVLAYLRQAGMIAD